LIPRKVDVAKVAFEVDTSTVDPTKR